MKASLSFLLVAALATICPLFGTDLTASAGLLVFRFEAHLSPFCASAWCLRRSTHQRTRVGPGVLACPTAGNGAQGGRRAAGTTTSGADHGAEVR